MARAMPHSNISRRYCIGLRDTGCLLGTKSSSPDRDATRKAWCSSWCPSFVESIASQRRFLERLTGKHMAELFPFIGRLRRGDLG